MDSRDIVCIKSLQRSIASHFPDIIEAQIKQYIKNVWNTDEFRIFYNMSRDSTIEAVRPPGRKNENNVTLLSTFKC